MDEIMYMDENKGSSYDIDPMLQIEKFEGTSGIWILEFDGEHSNSRSRARIVLITHSEEATFFSYRLEYDCTNNIDEYKSLLIGIKLALNRNIKCLKVTWDYDMVVSQVKLIFFAKIERLRKYSDSVRDTIELFDVFSINVVPREKKYVVDALVVSVSTLQPSGEVLQDLCKMEVVFRPSIPDNLEHWQVFDDASQILRFLQSSKDFTVSQIIILADSMNLEVIKFPNDTLPKGCVPLERMFYKHDMYKGKLVVDQFDKAFEFNLGSKNEPRMVNIGKGTTKAERDGILDII
jgi:ribonuclease HI